MFTSYKDIMHTLYQCDRFSQVFEEILNLLGKDLQKNGISMHQGITTVMPYGDGTVGIVEAAFYFDVVHYGKTYSFGLRFRPLETRYLKENAGIIHNIMNMAPDKAAAYIADEISDFQYKAAPYFADKINNFRIVTEFIDGEAYGIEYGNIVNKIRCQLRMDIKAADELEPVNEKNS